MSVLPGDVPQLHRRRSLPEAVDAVIRQRRRVVVSEPYLAQLRIQARRVRRSGRSTAAPDVRGALS